MHSHIEIVKSNTVPFSQQILASMNRKMMAKVRKTCNKNIEELVQIAIKQDFQNFCLIFRPLLPGYPILPCLPFGPGGSL